MIRFKVTALVFLAIALAGFAVACGSGSSDKDEQQVQLVYQDWRTAWFSPMVEEMMETFHETHPNIRVFYTPDPKGLADIMLDQMKAGTAPDVFQGCCSYFPIWAQEGFTLDLRPFIEEDLAELATSDWDPAQYGSFLTRDGLRYAVPKYHGALALYYNKDLFDEYGVAYPDGSWDHDDYLSAMKQLTDDRDGDGNTDLWGSMIDISWDRIQVHLNGWGGNIVDPNDPTACGMDDPQAMEALEWIRARIWDDGVIATNLDVQGLATRDAFIGGQLSMVEDGSWALKDILSKSDFRVPFPFRTGAARHPGNHRWVWDIRWDRASGRSLGIGQILGQRGLRQGDGPSQFPSASQGVFG